jgi:hypothetical protein
MFNPKEELDAVAQRLVQSDRRCMQEVCICARLRFAPPGLRVSARVHTTLVPRYCKLGSSNPSPI